MLLITAVIPTKNRPNDLKLAVQSIFDQLRKPDQLVIIDQSEICCVEEEISFLSSKYKNIRVNYIWNVSIPGLVAAKAESLKHASGDLICFLEDDIILEPDYFREMELGFIENPGMLGCSGIITNPPKKSWIYAVLFNIFHRGIFYDKRPNIYAFNKIKMDKLIETRAISGGSSAWRREVFDNIKFDEKNGFHMIEDFEFSMRASNFFGRKFFINPMAKLAHYSAPSNRGSIDIKYERKTIEWILYYKKNKCVSFATINLIWLLFGIALEALTLSLLNMTILPTLGYLRGLRFGFNKEILV